MRRNHPGVVLLGSDFKALGVARSLGRRGIPIVVVDDTPRSAWFSRYVVKRFHWRGRMSGERFTDFLLRLVHEQNLKRWILFPTQDDTVETVSQNSDRLAGAYQLITPGWELLRWAYDKRLLHQLATEIGVASPQTWLPTSEDDLEALPISLPAIIKPAMSIQLQHGLRRKALPAESMLALHEQYRAAARVVSPGDLMVQEIIPGDGKTQFSVAAFCRDGRILVAMTARRTRQYPIDFGLSSTFVEAIEVPELHGLAKSVIGRLRLSGMVEVEVKWDRRDGRYKLLDVNVRPWGWHTLCTASGIDFPYLLYCDALGRPLPNAMARYGLRWRRLITDLPAAAQEIRAGIITPWGYARSLIGPTVGSVSDLRDPLPVLGDIAVALARLRHLAKRRRRSSAPPQAFDGLASESLESERLSVLTQPPGP